MKEILEQIQACENLIELQALWDMYQDIKELREAMEIKCSYILSHLDDDE